MLIAISNKKRVLNAIIIFNRIMKRYGKSVSFPKNTDPTKTYSWCYFTKFLERYDELELDDDVMPSVMSAIVDYSRKNNLLRCGCSILVKIDLVKICEEKFKKEVEFENKVLEGIRQSHDFLYKQLCLEGTKNPHLTLKDLLVRRISRNAYANITRWYEMRRITMPYIAVSRSCRKALRFIGSDESDIFPTPRQFIKIRLNLTMPGSLLDELRMVLDKDLLED
jgi:hypothetical protein